MTNNKDLFANCKAGQTEELKKLLNNKRKLEYELRKVKFKIDVLTKDLSDILLSDCLLNKTAYFALKNFSNFINLQQLVDAGTSEIQLVLSNNGLHEGMEEVIAAIRYLLVNTSNILIGTKTRVDEVEEEV